MSHPLPELLDALARSHDRLGSVLSSVDDVEAPSYDDGWSIADVASHLGSGAQIFMLLLDAGMSGGAAPGADDMRPIWDVWNAKSPQQQASDVVDVDAAFIARVRELPTETASSWRLDVFGTTRDLAGLIQMRLGEHLMHTWDIAVAGDPSATVEAAGVAMIFENLPALAERVGKPTERAASVLVQTSDSASSFVLGLSGDGIRLAPLAEGGTPEHDATLSLPGEAFARLIYGRLDAGHTPDGVEVSGVDLETLRAALPGF